MNTIQRFLLPGSLMCALLLTACNDDHKNRVPTAANANLTTMAETQINGTLMGADGDGDVITFAAATGPAKGTVIVHADGSFVYTPNADTVGTDQFTFRTFDKKATSEVGVVTITITAIPVAFDGYSRQVFAQDSSAQPFSLNSRDVQQNVTDPAAYDDLLP